MKKILVAQSFVLGIIALALICFLLVGIIFGFSGRGGFGFSFYSSETKITNSQSFNAKGIDKISLNYTAEKIILKPSGNQQIIIEEHLLSSNAEKQSEIVNSTSEIVVNSRAGNWFTFDLARMPYVVLFVPENFSGSLNLNTSSGGIKSDFSWLKLNQFDAKTSSGGISLKGLFATGGINLQASSGSIKIDGDIGSKAALYIKANSGGIKIFGTAQAGTTNISCTSGSIKINKIIGQVAINSSSGSIKIEDFAGHGSISNSSGGISAGISGLSGNLNLQASSGGIRVQLATPLSFHFSASVNSGGINTPFNSSLSFSQNGKSANGSVGASPQHSLSCVSRSGGIKIY